MALPTRPGRRGDDTCRGGAPAIVSEGLGRIVILHFGRGDKLREGIRDKLQELGIKNAVLIGAIGTFEKARFHRIKNLNPLLRTRSWRSRARWSWPAWPASWPTLPRPAPDLNRAKRRLAMNYELPSHHRNQHRCSR